MSLRQPSVFDYISPKNYLIDYYKFRKLNDREFSYQKWADELGFSDRSFLRMVVTGRRNISGATLDRLTANFDFDELQKQYFSQMVAYANEIDATTKAKVGERLASLLKLAHERTITPPSIDFLADPKIPALHVLLSFDDSTRDLASLSERLGESEERVREWIGALEKLEMIEKDSAAEWWQVKNNSFRIPDHPGHEALMQFHKTSLKRAAEAVHLPKESRKFRSLLLPLNRSQLEQVWKLFDKFATEALGRYEGKALADRELYQFNFNLIPVKDSKVDSSAD